jgi:hypothetical protein
MPDDTRQKELLEDLESDGDSFFGGGFWNNIIDLTLTILTVLASLVSAGLAALAAAGPKIVSPWLVAAVAAVPAAAASIQKIVGVRERSNWYFTYAAHVRSLATRLRFADPPNVEAITNERAQLELDMEKEWARFGSSAMLLSPIVKPRTPVHRRSKLLHNNVLYHALKQKAMGK